MREQRNFEQLLSRMWEIHQTKDRDYAGSDAYGNFRTSEAFGLVPSVAAFVRLSDKFHRAATLIRRERETGEGPGVTDEAVEDTLLDLANYALIVLVLRGEEKGKSRSMEAMP